jgi:hypothetical protein
LADITPASDASLLTNFGVFPAIIAATIPARRTAVAGIVLMKTSAPRSVILILEARRWAILDREA